MKSALQSITLLTLTALQLTSFNALAMGARHEANLYPQYENASLLRFAHMAGVDDTSLQQFFASMRDSSPQEIPSHNVQRCIRHINDTNAGRNIMIDCLSGLGRGILSQDLFFALEASASGRYAEQDQPEVAKTLFLIGFLEDLIRQNRVNQGLPASWFDEQKGFLPERAQEQFAYQNGDIILGMGNTSISSLISQVTEPQSRFSHAFLIKKSEAGTLSTLEALVQTGPREFDAKHYKTDLYNELWVTRWTNIEGRNQLIQKSLDWASQTAAEKRPYDFNMDINDESNIYCSELVITAMRKSTGRDLSELLPYHSKIRSEPVFKFTHRIGVTNYDIPSPGDLAGSRFVSLKAKYRKSSDLMRSWDLFMMGDVFVDHLEHGADFDDDPAFLLIPLPIYLVNLFPAMTFEELRIIPKHVGPGKLALMATNELEIYQPAIKYARERSLHSSDMLQVAPWQTRASMELWIDTSTAGHRFFKIKK